MYATHDSMCTGAVYLQDTNQVPIISALGDGVADECFGVSAVDAKLFDVLQAKLKDSHGVGVKHATRRVRAPLCPPIRPRL